ncbi:MAG: hypothetical protein ACYC9Y_02890 [Candidatus Methylomirabilia bacterium]
MHPVLFSLGLLTAAFVLHLVVWRIRIPSNAVIWLLVIFLGTGAAGLGGALALRGQLPGLAWDASEVLSVVLAHVAFSLAYIVTYSGLEQDGPSVTLAKFTDMAGARGRSREEFFRVITDDLIVASRLRALLDSGWVAREAGRYRLTPRGMFWHSVFYLWRRLLGLPEGG